MDSYITDIVKHLEDAVVAVRQQALSLLIQELLVALAKHNYQFDEVLDALADYAMQRQDWAEVVKLLEQAASDVQDIRKRMS